MVYLKNIGTIERSLRVGVGLVAVVGALAVYGFTPPAYKIAAIGLIGALTGAVGFCPACALFGRKLKKGAP